MCSFPLFCFINRFILILIEKIEITPETYTDPRFFFLMYFCSFLFTIMYFEPIGVFFCSFFLMVCFYSHVIFIMMYFVIIVFYFTHFCSSCFSGILYK